MHTTITLPELAVKDVEVTWDKLNRDTIVIPDQVAYALRTAINHDWREMGDIGWGVSADFDEHSWVYRTTATILAAYAASPVPPGLSPWDHDAAHGARVAAEYGQHMYAAIVGESGWDPRTRWWVNYRANVHRFHVPGSPHRRGAVYRYEG